MQTAAALVGRLRRAQLRWIGCRPCLLRGQGCHRTPTHIVRFPEARSGHQAMLLVHGAC